MVDNKALGRLLAAKQLLTRQQYKTIKGQILAGDADGAMRGLEKLVSQNATKKNNTHLIRLCPHCRKPVIPSDIPDYVWQCLDCDEDFYDIECYRAEGR